MIIDPGKVAAPAAAPSGTIKDGDTAGFANDVIKASMTVPVIVDFWATWCGPCQAQSPIVNGIAERYKGRGVAVVGVNTSDEDGLAERFVHKKGLGFPMVYDEGNAIARQYGVTSLPTLIVVSKAGKVVAVRRGVTSDSALDEIVRRHM